MRVDAASDVGKVRPRNEDAWVWRRIRTLELLAVADGLGGHRAGDVASRLALDELAKGLDVDGAETGEASRESLLRAVRRANQAVWEAARARAEWQGMGTTLTAALVDGDRLTLAHVGDSRAYLWRAGSLRQLTSDHSLVQALVARGALSEEEAEHVPERHILTRAVGTSPEVEVDVLEIRLEPGDRLVLATDGLSAALNKEQVAALLAEGGDRPAHRLVEAANRGGAPDNVTVLVADLPAGGEEQDQTGLAAGGLG
ncbi:MAG: Stp1/IreP family PP2C-type Ser/Thr phosphatase [Bacillota bacterium]|nr:Stp1/IreP family PP2C-type Ser/Thr phosphatase [Bacillota bacterium]